MTNHRIIFQKILEIQFEEQKNEAQNDTTSIKRIPKILNLFSFKSAFLEDIIMDGQQKDRSKNIVCFYKVFSIDIENTDFKCYKSILNIMLLTL